MSQETRLDDGGITEIPVAIAAVAPRRFHAALARLAVDVARAVLGGAAAALRAVPVGRRHPHLPQATPQFTMNW